MVLDILNFHQLFSISKVKQQIHNSVQQHTTLLHSKSMRHNPPLLILQTVMQRWMLLNALKHKQLHHIVQKSRSHRNNVSPADECGNDDAPSGAAAVSARLLGVHMGVWGLITLASPAAKPERVEKEENKVQAQTQQRHSTEEQHRLRKEWEKKQKTN